MGKGSVSKIDTNAFEEVINSINNIVTAYGTSKKNITNATDGLLHGWKGKGKDAFEDAYDLLKTELVDEEENLKTVATDLQSMKDSYEDWDSTLKKSLQEA